MLVLSRCSNQSIMVGDDIRITVINVRGDKVRIGIEAPNDIPVHRQEVYNAIKKSLESTDDKEDENRPES